MNHSWATVGGFAARASHRRIHLRHWVPTPLAIIATGLLILTLSLRGVIPTRTSD